MRADRCFFRALCAGVYWRGSAGLFFVYLALLLVFCGCEEQKVYTSTNSAALSKAKVSTDDLENRLDEFEEIFMSRTKTAAADIDRLSGDPKKIKMTLLWRSRAISALHNIREQPQPVMAMVDTWLLCIRLHTYMESGEAGNIFGEHKEIATSTTQELESQIQEIAAAVLPSDLFEQTTAELKRLAAANPIQSGFGKTLMYSNQTKTKEPGVFQSLISIPMSPVRALRGVDRTPDSIYDFSNTTQRLTDVVQELPESTRWQLLLLLYDLEETNMANSFLKSLQDISESSNRLSATAERVAVLLQDTDKNQDQIRQTLAQVSETAESLKSLLKTTQKTAGNFSDTAGAIDQAATSWADAARATKELAEQFEADEGSDSPQEKTDWKATAEAIRQAASEITLASEKIPAQTDRITAQINSIVTRVTWHLAGLIVLIFCLCLLYRLLKSKSPAGGD